MCLALTASTKCLDPEGYGLDKRTSNAWGRKSAGEKQGPKAETSERETKRTKWWLVGTGTSQEEEGDATKKNPKRPKLHQKACTPPKGPSLVVVLKCCIGRSGW